MRNVEAAVIRDTVKKLCIDSNLFLPDDVKKALEQSIEIEKSPLGREILRDIVKNAEIAARDEVPICQDTGFAVFFVELGQEVAVVGGGFNDAINEGVRQGYKEGYLRKSIVDDPFYRRKNTSDNTPAIIHTFIVPGDRIRITIAPKGGGSENVGAQYRLPDEQLHAGRDLDGVRRVILDAAFKAQGQGCPPGVLGVGIGGDRSSSYAASKKVLLRRLDDVNPDSILAALEIQITNEVNQLGIGPMGLGGKTSLMGVKLATLHRLPACYFVSISYMCWAYRRRKMMVDGADVSFV